MQIEANNRLGSVRPQVGQRPVAATSNPNAASQVELRQSEAVNAVLSTVPDARTAEVERARKLIAQEDYPPVAILRGIANLIAVSAVPDKNQ